MQRSSRASRPIKKRPGKYHHGELRRALVDATIGIVQSEGTGAVSLSAAARRVGVSPQASYNHFADKEELMAAAAEECVRELARAMREARDACDGPGERLEATGVAYVRFAHAHVPQFRLLSAPELAHKGRHPSLLTAYEDAFGVLLEAMAAAQRAGIVREGDTRKLAVSAWGLVHGTAWLGIDGQLTISGVAGDPAALAREVVRVLFQGLRA